MFIELLQKRYATKKFDATKKISTEQLDRILEAGRLSPSSYGLQPYRFVVIETQALKEKIQPVCFNQPQITQASHIILIQAKRSIDAAFVDKYVHLIASERSMPVEALAPYRAMMVDSVVEGHLVKDVLAWNQRQAYIALGFMLFAAALESVDACPMEGFMQDQLDALLETDSAYQTTALLTLGHRDTEDLFAQYRKVRWSKEDLILTL
jgi:nitroreductase